MCHDPAQEATRTLVDRLFVCTRASKIFAATLGSVFVVGTAVLAAPTHKRLCGAIATPLVALLMWVFLEPSPNHYAEFLCGVVAGGLVTYVFRRSDVLSAA